MEKIELRYFFKCETLENVLQYRYVSENNKTSWQDVPVVYNESDTDSK